MTSRKIPLETTMESPAAPPVAVLLAPVALPPLAEPMAPALVVETKDKIVAALHTVFDPEIPVNIYELGLIYDITIDPRTAGVLVRMTLTSPACPAAGAIPGEVKAKVEHVPNVAAAQVDLVWDPPWDKDRMSEAAKLQLGIDD